MIDVILFSEDETLIDWIETPLACNHLTSCCADLKIALGNNPGKKDFHFSNISSHNWCPNNQALKASFLSTNLKTVRQC